MKKSPGRVGEICEGKESVSNRQIEFTLSFLCLYPKLILICIFLPQIRERLIVWDHQKSARERTSHV